ncbi:hypothetical protein AVDCRST_MAG94-4887 [uncultured Leptolyngbya sp.]|uniref:Uncharacterized protein n=1 Tax=uncultured Leptolyngbya sp. TaxID=332963 RepID=A0A6J4N8L7_9CYAN|nr:hypothetical protein AVDCRST_MAG94-4887 [uncultured Leptolyngbya sp.]
MRVKGGESEGVTAVLILWLIGLNKPLPAIRPQVDPSLRAKLDAFCFQERSLARAS